MKMNPVNGHFQAPDWDCDYISFGGGKRHLLLLPGVGDGFTTAKGLALPFSLLYRCFGRDFRVHVVSRRNDLPPDFTTRDMACDLAAWMDGMDIPQADIIGVSQGGMIAQALALDHPERVGRLVLAVTAPRPNPVLEQTMDTWLALSARHEFAAIMEDTARRSYVGSYRRRAILQNKLVGRLVVPEDFARFETLCRSCLSHDLLGELGTLGCPTLVLGGGQDAVAGPAAAAELARAIPGAELHLYPDQSHGVYEQERDFNRRILSFLREPV